VEHHHAGSQLVALQVRVERAQLVRQHHALVADGLGAERGDVVVGHIAQRLLAAAARQEQRQSELFGALRGTGIDEHLLDARQRGARQLAADVRISGHHAPAARRAAGFAQACVEFVAATLRGLRVMGQEHHAGGEVGPGRDARLLRQPSQEHGGLAQQQATAITGEAVGGDATAVGHARERGDRGVHQQPGGLVVQLRDHAETAGVAFVLRVVEPLAVAEGHLCLVAMSGERRHLSLLHRGRPCMAVFPARARHACHWSAASRPPDVPD